MLAGRARNRRRLEADLGVAAVSVLPEILEPIGRHLAVSNRVHDIFVAHVMLEGSGVMPVVCQLISGGMAKHVGVDREW